MTPIAAQIMAVIQAIMKMNFRPEEILQVTSWLILFNSSRRKDPGTLLVTKFWWKIPFYTFVSQVFHIWQLSEPEYWLGEISNHWKSFAKVDKDQLEYRSLWFKLWEETGRFSAPCSKSGFANKSVTKGERVSISQKVEFNANLLLYLCLWLI